MKSAASWIALSAVVATAACGGANDEIAPVSAAEVRGPAGDYPMVLGEPFMIDGVTYTPADTLNYDSVGYAETDAAEGISGSHRTLPLPSYVEVTSLETGRTILVRMTRRGPMQGSNLVSLSPQAWAQLGAPPMSRLPVRVRRVNPPEVERALLRSGSQAPARMDTPPGLLAVLKRKLGIAPAPGLAATPPAPAEAGKAVSVPAAAALPRAAAKPLPKLPAPASTATAAMPAPKPEAKPVATAETGLFVQVGAFSSKDRAEAAARSVGGSAAQAGKFWRVRTGPYKDRGQADAALAKARRSGYADAQVVTVP
ncbi:SPOR domain-containing protein [Novosphingobium sp. CECT 9465]|uniref:SPOR domain-containing protein n=1 Tax=Novosphingobium sp. CECT 9465 TaxID=2829794 RepID=UPI001E65CE7C|nr:SPOR domain-containing protein [Novosphingobium sp. CECT 9465]CAH0496700.1 Endolytic peptidoglycan transglycosylase RlpA [Novosphingobium sp. CECT 9465]